MLLHSCASLFTSLRAVHALLCARTGCVCMLAPSDLAIRRSRARRTVSPAPGERKGAREFGASAMAASRRERGTRQRGGPCALGASHDLIRERWAARRKPRKRERRLLLFLAPSGLDPPSPSPLAQRCAGTRCCVPSSPFPLSLSLEGVRCGVLGGFARRTLHSASTPSIGPAF